MEGIWLFSRDTWGQEQADRYIGAITATFQKLVDGSVRSRPAESTKPGLRKAQVARHVVFFRDVGEVVEVVRVLHERMDVGRV